MYFRYISDKQHCIQLKRIERQRWEDDLKRLIHKPGDRPLRRQLYHRWDGDRMQHNVLFLFICVTMKIEVIV